MSIQEEEDQAMREIEVRLRERFPSVDADTVRRTVSESHHDFNGRPIRDFVPVLVERDAAEHLAEAHGRKPRVPA